MTARELDAATDKSEDAGLVASIDIGQVFDLAHASWNTYAEERLAEDLPDAVADAEYNRMIGPLIAANAILVAAEKIAQAIRDQG